jgi:hypothetical protein
MINKEDLLGKIKSRGYWRIHFEPPKSETVLESPLKCKEIVMKSWVDFQGWDFPHFPDHNDTYQEIGYGDGYCEALTNFGQYKELWRLYKSSQFISYVAFPEDWYEEHIWVWTRDKYKDIKPGEKIGVYFNIIMLSCQLFEFLSKLSQRGLYIDGVKVHIKLFNTVNRQLWGQKRSWETDHAIFKTHSNEITAFDNYLYQEELIINTAKSSIKTIKTIFGCFGWEPSEEQIAMYVQNMVSRK